MRQKFTLITLGVANLSKALTFYEGLGWIKSKEPRGLCLISFRRNSLGTISSS